MDALGFQEGEGFQKIVHLGQGLTSGESHSAFLTVVTYEIIKAVYAACLDAYVRQVILVGAGTVTNVDELRRATKLGARFSVSPGFSKKVVDLGLVMLPGVITPSEVILSKTMRLTIL